MELNDKELKEISKLSIELQDKIKTVFSSSYYKLFLAFDKQISAFAEDVIKKPYTIRGSGESDMSKAEFDSMLKAMDKMDALSEMREKFRLKLLPNELEEAGKITTMSDIRKAALDNG